jgi:hypothetical protein
MKHVILCRSITNRIESNTVMFSGCHVDDYFMIWIDEEDEELNLKNNLTTRRLVKATTMVRK